MNTIKDHVVHNAIFQFYTALACMPAPVDCQIIGTMRLACSHFHNERDFNFVSDLNSLPPADSHGNEYDLTPLARNIDDAPWIAMDPSGAKARSFYINVCKPLPSIQGCPGWCSS